MEVLFDQAGAGRGGGVVGKEQNVRAEMGGIAKWN